MKISEIFTQFRRIDPDPQYSEKSRRAVLASAQNGAFPIRERGLMVFLRALETGAALVLAGFFIVLATGGFSGSRYLAPVQYAVIDPSGLKAEAQAIDIQIQLANLDYSEVTSTSQSTTPAAPAAMHPLAMTGLGAATSTEATSSSTGTGDASSTATSTSLSVNQALEALSR